MITRRGRPAARLVAYEAPDDADARRRRIEDSIERIRRLREGIAHPLSIDAILNARHEGHRH